MAEEEGIGKSERGAENKVERKESMSISIMRVTTGAHEQDVSVDNKTRIISRRGALLWLPVLFANDVVHGSWYLSS